jgi:hypothetical protein
MSLCLKARTREAETKSPLRNCVSGLGYPEKLLSYHPKSSAGTLIA